ncbi:WecB/TagA/CpsF family glycosyltransferase [Asticcacaulis sp. BYS171W]|uniref:WecB/TagA/CpsF family glycosyltransferase n=1 Tax=Asticcacaulis aquaticus TaxID=2984212 RepID=A0ABT5HRL3_9CAUL|nr:WecB/TagA/CpsF family glycosyltransferase [Asticcacaulis aquaticus]MDC7682705.1 WecB/TagA/CpsF family glycosyltransferase [Asticcacaulis aquaticus]
MEHPCRPSHVRRLPLLGAEVDVVTPDMVMDFISAARGQKAIVANHNLHSLYLFKKRADMRRFYDHAALIEIDSVPMIAWAKLMGHDVSRAHRCTYLDFRDTFWGRAVAEGWRVYHIGGAPEHNAASKQAILKRHPGAQLEVRSGYFDVNGPANELLLADILAHKPDVLLVGMGMPRQETWILNNLDKLPECVILPVGAAFDYEAGVMYTPPRWAGQMGVEWLVRFFHEPKRLFERYFVEPWVLIPQMLGDLRQRGKRTA